MFLLQIHVPERKFHTHITKLIELWRWFWFDFVYFVGEIRSFDFILVWNNYSYFLSAAKLKHISILQFKFPAESVPRFNPLSSSFSCFAKIDLPPVSRLSLWDLSVVNMRWFVCRRWSKALRHFLLRQRFGWQRHTYTKKLNDERS